MANCLRRAYATIGFRFFRSRVAPRYGHAVLEHQLTSQPATNRQPEYAHNGDPEVCQLAEALVAKIMGVPVRERCAREEFPQCRFEITDRAK